MAKNKRTQRQKQTYKRRKRNPEKRDIRRKKAKKRKIKKIRVLLLLLLIIILAIIFVKCQKDNGTSQISSEVSETAEETSEGITTEEQTEVETVSYLDTLLEAELPDEFEIDVEPVLQNPELPSGCEITSLTTVLNYWGYDVDKLTMAEYYLVTEQEGGVCDFDTAFVGSPYAESSFGCFAQVIATSALNFFEDQDEKMSVENLSGDDIEDIYHYVAAGYPIVIWETQYNLHDPVWTYYWTLDDGTEVYFPNYEHCMVLTGYNKTLNEVYVCDPLEGACTYDMDRFEEIYIEMKKQAVLVYNDELNLEISD